MNPCPYCESEATFELTIIDDKTVEHICDDCGCTFNVATAPAEEVISK
jgi:transposase-like protein